MYLDKGNDSQFLHYRPRLSADIWNEALLPLEISQPHRHRFEVTYFLSLLFMIFMRYQCAYFRETSGALQEQITASHQACNHMRVSQLPGQSPSQIFMTLHDLDARGRR